MNRFPHARDGSHRSLAVRSLASIAGLLVASLALAARAAAQAPPNIVLVLADDLGYGDVGPYDHDDDPETPMVTNTPRLDQVAANGVRLTDYYVCAPVCTPSRTGLLTGRNSARVGLKGVLSPPHPCGIERTELTLAEMLHARGYATEIVGKWHLGSQPQHNPLLHGFDGFYGALYSNDMLPYFIMRDTTIVEAAPDQSTLMQSFLVEAKEFVSIAVAEKKPFFLYMPTPMPHAPVYVGSAFDGVTGRGLYADCVYEIDWSVGNLLDHLTDLGVADNTIVIFTSDNGPWHDTQSPPPDDREPWRWVGGSAGPLRGSKGTVYEGGIRVPFIASWPGHIPNGIEEHEPAICMDLVPTLAHAAGAELSSDLVYDGRDILPLLTATGARDGQDFFFYELDYPCDTSVANRKIWAMRSGKWKLHFNALSNPIELYDLDADVGETTPLTLPDVVATLLDKQRDFDCGLDDPPVVVAPSDDLALRRPVVVSSSVGCDTSSKAVDGQASTLWKSAIGEDQWIQVDLGQAYLLADVSFEWGSSFAVQYEIDVSSDAQVWSTVHHAAAGTGGHETVALWATARYVRMHALHSSAGDGYALFDLGVHGINLSRTNLRHSGPVH